jgi:hypothetical protein
MIYILVFIASASLGVYAKNKGRSPFWGALPFLTSAVIHFFTELSGGPSSDVLDLFGLTATLLLYFLVGQIKKATDLEKAKTDNSSP